LQAGITLTHVSYKGTAGAVTDVLAGHVPTMFLPVHVALPHLRAGKLKALAAGSPARLPQVADVPTLTELGYPALSVDMWYGVLAPKGTPADLVAQLNQEINQVLGQPAVKDAFDSQGMVPATATPQAFGEIVQKDLKRWAEVVQKAKISAE
jgi:tripartite-type tricarboxylate transporter receptor subunit TctC